MMRSFLQRFTNPDHLTRIYHRRDIHKYGWQIDDFTYGRLRVRQWGEGAKLRIKSYCSIANDVTIFLGGNHRTDWVSTYPFSGFKSLWPSMAQHPSTICTKGDVVIGADVWIGAGATILSGVTIGHGAVIGAQAVVSQNVPPYAIVTGNPARVMKKRFADGLIQQLLDTAWWDLPTHLVEQLAPCLHSGDVSAVIDTVKRMRNELDQGKRRD